MEGALRLRGLTTADNRFSFLLFNYSRRPYFLHSIELRWWFRGDKGQRSFSLSKAINKWINNLIYEFGAYYLDFLEPKEVLYREIEEGRDLRDIIRIEAEVYYYREYGEKRVLRFMIL